MIRECDSFAETLLRLDSETARLIAGRDWSATPLGPLESWPPSLRTSVSIILLSPVPIVMLWGEDGTMLYNDAYSIFAGGRHPQLLGSKVREGWPEVAEFNDNVMRVGLSGRTLAYRDQELTLYRNGKPEQVFMNLDYSPILGERGVPEGVLAIVIETTERVIAERRREEAEAALRAARDRAQGVLDNMAEAFVLLDGELRFLDINAEAVRLERRPRDALIGKTHWEVHPEAAPEIGKRLMKAVREKVPVSLEHNFHWTDGRETWIDMRAYPVGENLAVFYRDVTDRKRGEESLRASQAALAQLNASLEAQVAERTADLSHALQRLRAEVAERERAEAALRQMQKMEAIGQLSGGIAHDFNNLLGAILAGFELICRKAEDPKRVRQLAEAGLKSAERGAKLTGQLLAFSREQRIELKPVAIAELLNGMRDLLTRSLGPSIKLAFDIKSDGAVLADATQLEMAILNLAINARDAMKANGVLTIATRTLSIEGDIDLSPGDYMEVAVTDTGSGMTPEVMARAFEPFFTTKGLGKGTGLGLSQVYASARQAGGTARMESRPGEGTTVSILLSRVNIPVAGSDDLPVSQPGQRQGFADLLLVDDDQQLRGMLAASLGDAGFRVHQADNGRAALAMLEHSTPDVMIVDFAMPEMNGAELAGEVWSRDPSIPIIFASGFAETEAIEVIAGKDAVVLRKPFRLEQLQEAIGQQLARKGLVSRTAAE
ncbi:PAS domain-containing protein [Aestuariivirga sp.]|uniref:PAS domain-containing protein n=1 Tax=Aestuariivirga sp. TaxID=2650926 RepID=UPI0035AE5917